MGFYRPSFYFINVNGLISQYCPGHKKEPGLKMNFKCLKNSWAYFENVNVFFLIIIHEIKRKNSKSQHRKNEVKLVNSYLNVNATDLSPN
jgi:hypothetical protein